MPVALAAVHVGDDAGHVSAQSKHHEVKHGAPILTGLRLGHIALKGRGKFGIDDGLGNVEPGVEPLGTLLHIAHGVQVFVELGAVVVAEVATQHLGLVHDGIEHAAALGEPRTLSGDAAGLLAKEAVEDLLRIVLRR